jgi:phosphoribosylanthranilate isomerase
MSYAIKICGITCRDDVLMVSEEGADYAGVLVNVASSRRSLSLDDAKPLFSDSPLPMILLTFDRPASEVMFLAKELGPSGIQLAGNEPREEVCELKEACGCEIWKSLHISTDVRDCSMADQVVCLIEGYAEAGADRIVLDSAVPVGAHEQKGGTGKRFNWKLAHNVVSRVRTPIFLAGGISPENAGNALTEVTPYGIDLSSGVEMSAGRKDRHLVQKLVAVVKETERIHSDLAHTDKPV